MLTRQLLSQTKVVVRDEMCPAQTNKSFVLSCLTAAAHVTISDMLQAGPYHLLQRRFSFLTHPEASLSSSRIMAGIG